MSELSASVPLLRFSAGSMHFGIAAEDVAAVAPANDHAVHIGTILGIEPGTAERRLIYLAPVPGHEGQEPISFQAEVPVDVVRCNTDDILPLPAGIPKDCWKPVMGFANVAQQLILLLDIPSVIAKLMDTSPGETP